MIDVSRHGDMDSEADLQKRISHKISVHGSDICRMYSDVYHLRGDRLKNVKAQEILVAS